MENRVHSVIKNVRKNVVIIKLVCKSEKYAIELEDELNDMLDDNHSQIEKMNLAYGLTKMHTSSVGTSAFITYEFRLQKEAKAFELAFVKHINADGSNIFETFMISEVASAESDELDEFDVILVLPESAVSVLKSNKDIFGVCLTGYPNDKITRDMLSINNKKVKLTSKDTSGDKLDIKFRYQGDELIRSVPQRWLEITELTYKATVNTAWAALPKNIKGLKDNCYISMLGDEEVTVPLDYIALDGQKIKVSKDGDKFVDVAGSNRVYTAAMLLM